MDYTLLVRRLQPGGKLFAQFQDLALAQSASPDFGVKSKPRDVFGDQVIEAAIAAEVESHGDIWVADTRQTQGFAAELATRGIAQQTQLRQNLYGHIAVELLVMRTKHHSHAARTNQFDDTVVAQHLTDFWGRNHGQPGY